MLTIIGVRSTCVVCPQGQRGFLRICVDRRQKRWLRQHQHFSPHCRLYSYQFSRTRLYGQRVFRSCNLAVSTNEFSLSRWNIKPDEGLARHGGRRRQHRRCLGCGSALPFFFPAKTNSRQSFRQPSAPIFLFGREPSFHPGHACSHRTERKAESRTTASSAVARRGSSLTGRAPC